MNEFNRARLLAKIAYGDLEDQAGDSIYNHSLRVASYCETYGERTVAFLHDIIEDTDVTADDLIAFFNRRTVEDVVTLTRRSDETYANYIGRIIDSGSRTAVVVKLADLRDHFDSADAIPESLVKRYEKAKARLEAGLIALDLFQEEVA